MQVDKSLIKLETLYRLKTELNELGWSRTKNIKCLSRSPLSTLKISCQSEYVWTSKNGSEYTALILDENAKSGLGSFSWLNTSQPLDQKYENES